MTGYSVDGTFREYCISQACHVVRLPKQIPLDVVAPVSSGSSSITPELVNILLRLSASVPRASEPYMRVVHNPVAL